MAQQIQGRTEREATRRLMEDAVLTVLAHEPEPVRLKTALDLASNVCFHIEPDLHVVVGSSEHGVFQMTLDGRGAYITPGPNGLARIAELNVPSHEGAPGSARAAQVQLILDGVRLEIAAIDDVPSDADPHEVAAEVVRLQELERALHSAAVTARHKVRRTLMATGTSGVEEQPSDRLVVHVNTNAKMSRGKFAAQAVHAALMAVGAHPGTAVVVLGAKPRDIEALRIRVHDAGRTEVVPGTLTAGTNWPLTEREAAGDE